MATPESHTEAEAEATDTGRFLLVAIGASAGGLKALEEFIRAVPDGIDMSFVVIQHLSPMYKSVMPELLARHTTLSVQHADEGAVVRPGTVHLIPPGKNLTIKDGRLHLANQPAIRGVNLPIDIFFRSLAEDFGDRAVGVVLSGTGTDGTLGLREIKGAGGMVMVQTPTSAQFDGMPASAIATRVVDFVMDAAEMPAKLAQYAAFPKLSLQAGQGMQETAINRLLILLEDATGIDFSGYRRSTFLRRLDKRMQMNQVETLEDYLDFVAQNTRELDALRQDVLIGVTRFFRDEEAWQLLRDKLIPELWARFGSRENQEPHNELRAWSVACSTGEEAYTLAILLDEAARKAGADNNFKVFATDIDKQAIRVAAAGSYPESVTADIPHDLLNAYFHRKAGRYVINDRLRQKVIFSLHDITKNPPFNRIDLLSCRNMLIYLTSELQERVLSNFCFSLRTGGRLFLGPSESLGEYSAFFDTIDHKAKLFTYEGGAKPTLLQMALRRNTSARTVGVGTPSGPSISGMEHSILRQVMTRFAPATAVVNDRHHVLMTFGSIGDYLRLPPGRVSFDLLSMSSGTLSALLGTALHKTRQTQEPVEYQGLRLGSNGDKPVNIRVQPLAREGRSEQLYAVVIEERRSGSNGGAVSVSEDLSEAAESHLVDLERELRYTKENLQATIEELETANEELQATNEELLASNEELQSTNEELQSVNEELITVNAEFQLKIAALTEAGNDFDNLLLIAEIHTIFLDRDLSVRKFSPGDGPFNLVESDIGRSIRHFALDLQFPNMFQVISEVRLTLVPHDGVYASSNDTWYYVKIVPYRTRDDEIRGIVITMIDVTERQSIGKRLHYLERMYAERGSPIEIFLVDDDEEQTALMTTTLESSSLMNTVTVAHDGQSALDLLRERVEAGAALPDLMLLDLMLPDLHGLQVLEIIKKDEALSVVTVIVVSAVDRQEEVNKAYRLGAASYITKPVTVTRLTEAVSALGQYWLSMVRLPVTTN